MGVGKRRCPGCGREVEGRDANPTWPFCGERCRMVDLGRWMGEAYRIPGGRAGDGAAGGDDEEDGA